MLTATKLPRPDRPAVMGAVPGGLPMEGGADEPLVEQHFGGLSNYFAEVTPETVARRAAECIAEHPWLATGAALAAGIVFGALAGVTAPAVIRRRR